MERRERHQREAEREPAREVVLALAEALAPADDGDEADERLQRERAGEIERLVIRARWCRVRQPRAERAQERPRDEERDAGRGDRVRDRPVAVLRPAAAEPRDRDEREPEPAAQPGRPARRRPDFLAPDL